jgi:hypothetical protein
LIDVKKGDKIKEGWEGSDRDGGDHVTLTVFSEEGRNDHERKRPPQCFGGGSQ